MQHVAIDYRDARRQIADGDVLLFRDVPVWRGGYWYSAPLKIAGRSSYTHAAMAAWSGDRLLALQSTAVGSRKQAISVLVRRYQGSIDVYRVRPEVSFDSDSAVCEMLKIVRHRYGWVNLSKVALIHLCGVRWLARVSENDVEDSSYPPFCSEAVARACRIGGFGGRDDLVPNCADSYTEPGDLARSALLQYQFTLGGNP
jgi:hypothetical protein